MIPGSWVPGEVQPSEFDGKFYFAVKDAVNNYYMVDFTQLPDKFESLFLSIWFINQTKS